MPPSPARGDARPARSRSAPLETPVGDLWISVSDLGLYAISRDAPEDVVPDSETVAEVAEVADQLLAYFAGRRRTFELPLDLSGVSPFDVAVWEAARAIPYGETASYGELAAMAGHPGAARAAGGSMARCRLFPIVPCHRVIHADGSIVGWGSHTWVKRWLLELERSALPAPPAARKRPV